MGQREKADGGQGDDLVEQKVEVCPQRWLQNCERVICFREEMVGLAGTLPGRQAAC